MNKNDPPAEENLALAANTKKGRGQRFPSRKNSDRRPNPNQGRRRRDMSKIKCFDCLRFGHYARDCTKRSKNYRGKHHASVVDMDDEPQRKKEKEFDLDQEGKDIRKEYYLISALSETITNSSKTWLVDSGASRHMTSYRSALID
jgi:hypothetical protein